jgi:nitroreductase
MDVAEAIARRRALRAFEDRPADDSTVDALIEAMRLSASCFNHQPWRVVICRGEGLVKVKEALSKGNVWATAAPMILVIASKPSLDCRMNQGRDYFKFDCGLAVGQMLLRATELGLTAHPIAGYDPVKVREACHIPDDFVVITLVICGHPGTDESLLSDKQKADQQERPSRRAAEQSFFREVWGPAGER